MVRRIVRSTGPVVETETYDGHLAMSLSVALRESVELGEADRSMDHSCSVNESLTRIMRPPESQPSVRML